jgi:hypothetical protein
MRHAGLVTDRKDGLWSYYTLRPVENALARRHLNVLRTTLAQRSDAAPLLAKLHIWLQTKDLGANCSKATTAAPKKRPPRQAKPAQRGEASR